MKRIKNYFFEEIDNSGLVIFRILFGFLISVETFGAISTGWVYQTFGETSFNFTTIGLEWLQLPVGVMYGIYGIMGVLGILIMLGFQYRTSSFLFFILWTITYLIQKTHYNNHHYLMCLISGAMTLMPANRYFSIDSKLNPGLLSNTCSRWNVLFFILQIWIVYTYSSVHKIYPDWLAAKPIHLWFTDKATYPELAWLKDFLLDRNAQFTVAYLGIAFDGLIIPALLWRRTRLMAIIASFCFHLFNSLVFQMGIFPYLSLAFLIFFIDPKEISDKYFRAKPTILPQPTNEFAKNFIVVGFFLYFIIQLLMPLRHHLIEGNVFWTEEGHKMSWRMMLRSKSGHIYFTLKNTQADTVGVIDLKKHFTNAQINGIAKNPDMAWQTAQYLKKYYEQQGINAPKIYANCMVSLNGSEEKPLIDETIDLAHTPWLFFKHNPWILSYNFEK